VASALTKLSSLYPVKPVTAAQLEWERGHGGIPVVASCISLSCVILISNKQTNCNRRDHRAGEGGEIPLTHSTALKLTKL